MINFDDILTLKPIAYIHSPFTEKFGIPRQSGLTDTLAEIHFEPEYADPSAIRGLGDYSHLWLLWGFSANKPTQWHPTVRPPRLGGNTRVGVFATRSPYRPNPIGLSCIEFVSIETREHNELVIVVRGADLLDKTPIYDIKPYLPYVDSHPEAKGSFSDRKKEYSLEIHYEENVFENVSSAKKQQIIQLLSQDPRPSYHDDPERIYGMSFDGLEIKFKVASGILTILDIEHKKAASRTDE